MTADQLITYVIQNIEGGYYHPDMKSKLRGGENLGISGETMYGLDRANGAGSAVTNSDAGRKFWKLIDDNYGSHHGDTSYYGDMADGRKVPASVGAQLQEYTRTIIKSMFNDYAGRYLSPGAKSVIMSNPALQLQFLYACWNGPGHFQTFANLVNAAYANGTTAADALYQLVNDARRKKGGLFAIGADKLDAICEKYLGGVPGEEGGFGIAGWLLGGLAAFLLIKAISKK
jgi:hypothetical protein